MPPWINITQIAAALLVLLLGGCASNGPINSPEFDNRFTGVISKTENIFLYSSAEVRVGTYMEDEIILVDSYQGVMVLTNYAIRFLYWDAEVKDYSVQIDLPYRDLKQAKYGFNTLIPSYVAVRATNGESFAFMLDDEVVKLAYRFLMMGKAGHLSIPD
ncbi:MAG: hypothetical protein V7739_22155 [Motiliproteus sp.]